MKLKDQVPPDYRITGALMDDSGQSLANVQVTLSPARGRGEFRLPKTATAERLAPATVLQTTDGKRYRVTDLKQALIHQTIGPDQPLFEFQFQPA